MKQPTEKLPDDMAIWRFGVISPLLHRNPDGQSLTEALETAASRTFFLPNGREKSFTADTLRHWLYRYRKDGLNGLKDKVPKNQGSTSLPMELRKAIKECRKESPAWTIMRILNKLKEDNVWNGKKPGAGAIYRYCRENNLKRHPVGPSKKVRSYEYPCFGDLWMADFMHGPQVCLGRKDRKAILHAIIDDASRTIVAARFYLTEDTKALISDLMMAIQRFGIPKRFYTDNGAAFRSRHLIHVAARLQMSLPHTPPYLPQGRGKIERFFRSIRDGLITGRGRTTLDALNRDLDQWISNYHKRIHSSMGISPLNKRLSIKSVTSPLDNVRNIDALFRMECFKNIYSNGCIRLSGQQYDVPEALPGQKVKVSFLPWDLSVVYIGEEMTPVKPLDKIKNAMRFENPKQGKEPS